MHGLRQLSRAKHKSTGLIAVYADGLVQVAKSLGSEVSRWVSACGFRAEPGSHCLLADAHGHLRTVLVGISRDADIFAYANLARSLPEGDYHLDTAGEQVDAQSIALGWGLGAYQFDRYRKPKRSPACLGVDPVVLQAVAPVLQGVCQVRDLVNTPTEDMGPAELAATVQQLAKQHKAKFREWVGADLLKANFPTIHAVGRASHRPPRLVELTWGKSSNPQLALIGKGVCFDSGGLDLKSADGMRWMKKDMGGAAHAIALAGLVMQAKLPVYLRLLIPAVENSVAANAMRPGEVIRTRAGLTVEIDNTDAEGRLVLCDALAYAVESKPELIIDFATLTGAARIALGPELPALFANRDDLADRALAAGAQTQDPLWRMPLWKPYLRMLDSAIADTTNSASSRHAGAITAALYLQRFVPDSIAWMHLDVYAWNDADRPGRPRGGEALGLRALFAMLRQRYG